MAIEPVFLDTAYINGLLNTRDQWHERALEWQKKLSVEKRSLITTEFVLMEIGNGLAALKFRQDAANVIRALRNSPLVTTVAASAELFQNALELFDRRPDKDWGLTDCSSFVVMEDFELKDALTSDNHFRQAGYNALLLD